MQDAIATVRDAEPAIREGEPALPLRSDTILGVCQAIGEDFGFNPLWLRLAFATLFYLNPLLVTGTYLALGAGVALARWLYPVLAAAAETHLLAQPGSPAANEAGSEVSLAA